MNPFFSILVPTYNQAQYLGEALDSLSTQTDPDWEAIIVNDGSTDNTADIIEAYCQKDSRFQAIHKPNGGTGSALNVGLDNVKGEWICWLSSDDVFEVNKLEIHRQWINKYLETKFFFSDFRQLVGTTGKITNYNPNLRYNIPPIDFQTISLMEGNYIAGNSICISKSAWLAVGCFNEELRYAQDYDMWIRLAVKYPAVFIPEYTYLQRVYPEQESQRFSNFCIYDSAKSIIQLLNTHSFREIFPLVNIEDEQHLTKLFYKAIKLAFNHHALIYQFGFHPLLILKIKIFFDQYSKNSDQFDLILRNTLKQNANEKKDTLVDFWCNFCIHFLEDYDEQKKSNSELSLQDKCFTLSFENLGKSYYLWLNHIEFIRINSNPNNSISNYLNRFCNIDTTNLDDNSDHYKQTLNQVIHFQTTGQQNLYSQFIQSFSTKFIYYSFIQKLLLLEKFDVSLESIYETANNKYGHINAILSTMYVYTQRLFRLIRRGVFLSRLKGYIRYIFRNNLQK